MKTLLAANNNPEAEEMRHVFCQTMIELAGEYEELVVLDADLMAAMGMKPFAKAFPTRVVNCGIQEANMVGVAAGLSAAGKLPVAHTFAPFVTRRACDQVFVSAAYARLNVKLIGSDPGITAALNGGTHMPFEDMGIMRSIPGTCVLEPTDTVMLRQVLRMMMAGYGVHYMRLVRKNCAKIYEEGSTFELGKAVQLRAGTDATIIASGYCVAEALKAARALDEAGIKVRVLDSFTWKPLDEAAVLAAAADTGAIVTAENHNVVSGLGSAVAAVLAKNRPTPMEMVGVQDEFGEVGQPDYLAERFGLTGAHIAGAVKRVLARKTA